MNGKAVEKPPRPEYGLLDSVSPKQLKKALREVRDSFLPVHRPRSFLFWILSILFTVDGFDSVTYGKTAAV